MFQNARHFLTSVQRILGLFYEIKIQGYIVISNLGRVVLVRIMHAGNDFDLLRNVLASESFTKTEQIVQKIIDNKYLFFSIDQIEGVHHLIIKLEGFKRFAKKRS